MFLCQLGHPNAYVELGVQEDYYGITHVKIQRIGYRQPAHSDTDFTASEMKKIRNVRQRSFESQCGDASLHPRPTESECLGWDTANLLCFNKPSR